MVVGIMMCGFELRNFGGKAPRLSRQINQRLFWRLFHSLGKTHCASELQHMRDVVKKTTHGEWPNTNKYTCNANKRPICKQTWAFYFELQAMGSKESQNCSAFLRVTIMACTLLLRIDHRNDAQRILCKCFLGRQPMMWCKHAKKGDYLWIWVIGIIGYPIACNSK